MKLMMTDISGMGKKRKCEDNPSRKSHLVSTISSVCYFPWFERFVSRLALGGLIRLEFLSALPWTIAMMA
jgi:hypothetical protein